MNGLDNYLILLFSIHYCKFSCLTFCFIVNILNDESEKKIDEGIWSEDSQGVLAGDSSSIFCVFCKSVNTQWVGHIFIYTSSHLQALSQKVRFISSLGRLEFWFPFIIKFRETHSLLHIVNYANFRPPWVSF